MTARFGRYKRGFIRVSERATPKRPDGLMRLVGNVLPLVNLALYFLVDRTGGAHGHALEIVIAVGAVELAGIVWFCRRRTGRPALVWAPLGLAIDLATSAVMILTVLFVVVAIGYAVHGGGD